MYCCLFAKEISQTKPLVKNSDTEDLNKFAANLCKSLTHKKVLKSRNDYAESVKK
jgi:hypothetical protein